MVALVLLGPDKIPAAAHKISSFLKDLQRFRNSVHSQLRDTLEGTPLDDLGRHGELVDRLRNLDPHTLLEYLSASKPDDPTRPSGDPAEHRGASTDRSEAAEPDLRSVAGEESDLADRVTR